MLNSMEVATWFKAQNILTKDKLHYLMYLSQAIYLTIYDRPLFEEDFIAGRQGPYLASLEQVFLSEMDENLTKLNEKKGRFLTQILNVYGKLSSEMLSQMLRKEVPWIQARVLADEMTYISKEVMKDYYSQMEDIHELFTLTFKQ